MLCDDLEEWGWGLVGGRLKREGLYVYIELIHVVKQKLTRCCKAIIFQLKKYNKQFHRRSFSISVVAAK